jgi:hypothetical protein
MACTSLNTVAGTAIKPCWKIYRRTDYFSKKWYDFQYLAIYHEKRDFFVKNWMQVW